MSPSAPSLEEAAQRALAAVGVALRTVIASLYPAEPPLRELARLLSLHKTLVWRVMQVAYAREPLAAGPHLPGDEGLEKFLGAARKAGAPEPALHEVRQAVGAYRQLVKTHSGDRASFDVMLMSLSTPQDTAVEFKAARRAGYRAASYGWGVQTDVRVLSGIIMPVDDDRVDFATLRAHVKVRRIRHQGVMRLSRTIEHDTDEPGTRRVEASAVFPEDVVGGVPLIKPFCTQPLPLTQAVRLEGGNVEYRFADQPLGEQSTITIFTSEIRRGLIGARWRTETNQTNALMLTARDPIGKAVIDLWAPPGFARSHRALVVNAVGVDPLLQRPAAWHILPASAHVERQGTGPSAAHLGPVPSYARALERVCERLGWDLADFELHRLEVDYPLIGTCQVLQSELHDKPTA